MICPPDHPHGTSNVCYVKHKCRCDDCSSYNTEYAYWRRHQGSRTVPAEPTRRRIRALGALGWTRPMLAREVGRDQTLYNNALSKPRIHIRNARLIAEQYERLCMTVPAPSSGRESGAMQVTRRIAREKGWLPPLAWDDIEKGVAA